MAYVNRRHKNAYFRIEIFDFAEILNRRIAVEILFVIATLITWSYRYYAVRAVIKKKKYWMRLLI